MPIPLAVPIAAFALAALGKRKHVPRARAREATVTSHREHMPAATTTSASSTSIGRLLLSALGIPYSYGAGSPATPFGQMATGIKGGRGLDCSGFAQSALVALGRLPSSAPDRSAAALADLAAPVAIGAQRAGDLAFYGSGRVSHVMVVLTDADAAGVSEVIGASGGRPSTNGDDPNARIKSYTSHKYRRDFVAFGRI